MHTKLLIPRLIPLIRLVASCAAHAQVIGRVLIAVGEVSVSRAGQAINLGTGTAVEDGDTIRVGPASNAQIRFNDEGVVVLRPHSNNQLLSYSGSGASGSLGGGSIVDAATATIPGATYGWGR